MYVQLIPTTHTGSERNRGGKERGRERKTEIRDETESERANERGKHD